MVPLVVVTVGCEENTTWLLQCGVDMPGPINEHLWLVSQRLLYYNIFLLLLSFVVVWLADTFLWKERQLIASKLSMYAHFFGLMNLDKVHMANSCHYHKKNDLSSLTHSLTHFPTLPIHLSKYISFHFQKKTFISSLKLWSAFLYTFFPLQSFISNKTNSCGGTGQLAASNLLVCLSRYANKFAFYDTHRVHYSATLSSPLFFFFVYIFFPIIFLLAFFRACPPSSDHWPKQTNNNKILQLPLYDKRCPIPLTF